MIKYFISIFVLYMIIVSCAGNCKYVTMVKEVSPDGKYLAVSYWKDCGAVATGSPQVSIFTLPDTNLPDDGNVVIDCLGITVDKWISPDTLVLNTRNNVRPKFAAAKFGDINIIYKGKYSRGFQYFFSGYDVKNNAVIFKHSSRQNMYYEQRIPLEIPVNNLKIILEKGRIKQIDIINDFVLKEKEILYGDVEAEHDVSLKGPIFPDGLSINDEKKLISLIINNN